MFIKDSLKGPTSYTTHKISHRNKKMKTGKKKFVYTFNRIVCRILKGFPLWFVVCVWTALKRAKFSSLLIGISNSVQTFQRILHQLDDTSSIFPLVFPKHLECPEFSKKKYGEKLKENLINNFMERNTQRKPSSRAGKQAIHACVSCRQKIYIIKDV